MQVDQLASPRLQALFIPANGGLLSSETRPRSSVSSQSLQTSARVGKGVPFLRPALKVWGRASGRVKQCGLGRFFEDKFLSRQATRASLLHVCCLGSTDSFRPS